MCKITADGKALMVWLYVACSDWRQRLTWRRQGRGPGGGPGLWVHGRPIEGVRPDLIRAVH
jgi:hypothetical protein